MSNKNEYYSQIGTRIRNARKSKSLTQTELANLLGKSLRTIQKYESGEIKVSIPIIKEIANILECELTYFIGNKSNKIIKENCNELTHDLVELIDKKRLLMYLNEWWLSETPTARRNHFSVEDKLQKNSSMELIEEFIKVVEEQTIAYNIDKVIEELKTESMKGNTNKASIPTEKAIEIIKAGVIAN